MELLNKLLSSAKLIIANSLNAIPTPEEGAEEDKLAEEVSVKVISSTVEAVYSGYFLSPFNRGGGSLNLAGDCCVLVVA